MGGDSSFSRIINDYYGSRSNPLDSCHHDSNYRSLETYDEQDYRERDQQEVMQRRNYLRALGGLPLTALGVAGCLSGGTNRPAKRALAAQAIGEAWTYTETGSPTVTEKGTIVAIYRAAETYPRTVRLRLWPCEGETLEALGSCSLGNLPDRKRANDSIKTATRSIGETAFLWWNGVVTDIEVVTSNHVFRLTHTPAVESTQKIPSRDARIQELTNIARLQTEKLVGMANN